TAHADRPAPEAVAEVDAHAPVADVDVGRGVGRRIVLRLRAVRIGLFGQELAAERAFGVAPLLHAHEVGRLARLGGAACGGDALPRALETGRRGVAAGRGLLRRLAQLALDLLEGRRPRARVFEVDVGPVAGDDRY